MATKKSPIQEWLDSEERNYQDGVKLYAGHPTAMRGLVNTLQRKENGYTREKLVYVLTKAAEVDAEGATKALKKKELKLSEKKVEVKQKKKSPAQKKKLEQAVANPVTDQSEEKKGDEEISSTIPPLDPQIGPPTQETPS